MSTWITTCLLLAGPLFFAALGDLISEEIRGWLDLAPRAVLRLAAMWLSPEQRAAIYHDEWLPELIYILKGAESRPITRLVLGITYATGLVLAARRIARHLAVTSANNQPVQVSNIPSGIKDRYEIWLSQMPLTDRVEVLAAAKSITDYGRAEVDHVILAHNDIHVRYKNGSVVSARAALRAVRSAREPDSGHHETPDNGTV